MHSVKPISIYYKFMLFVLPLLTCIGVKKDLPSARMRSEGYSTWSVRFLALYIPHQARNTAGHVLKVKRRLFN